jgi:hypothetical protein
LSGTFDVDNYGDLLFPRLFERELLRRLPGASVRCFSPSGPEHRVAMNGTWSPEALGLWIAAIPPDVEIVLLETRRCHGDDRFADAVAERLGRPAFQSAATARSRTWGVPGALTMLGGVIS